MLIPVELTCSSAAHHDIHFPQSHRRMLIGHTTVWNVASTETATFHSVVLLLLTVVYWNISDSYRLFTIRFWNSNFILVIISELIFAKCCWLVQIPCESKKKQDKRNDTLLLPIISPVVGWFAKFFVRLSSKCAVKWLLKISLHLKICRYITLWNLCVQKLIL